MDTTTQIPHDQVLVDIHQKTGKVIKWTTKKRQTNELAQAFRRIEKKYSMNFEGRAYQLEQCGAWLEFKEFKEYGHKTLNRASFCKYRLCPMCSWRRSLKIYGQVSQIMEVLTNQGYRFLFATMSKKNCTHSEMTDEITLLFNGYTALLRKPDVKKRIYGSMRSLEVTHNLDRKSIYFDTFNFHIHAIFVVRSRYFKKDYLKQSEWLKIWKNSVKVCYDPHFDIRAIKLKDKGAIREISKYATKPNDILVADPELMDTAIISLDTALAGRRLISFTGIMKKVKADLNLDDIENGDLVNVDGESDINDELNYVIRRYSWHVGYNAYTKS